MSPVRRLVAVLCALVLLAACGGGDDGGSGDDAGDGEATSTTDDTTDDGAEDDTTDDGSDTDDGAEDDTTDDGAQDDTTDDGSEDDGGEEVGAGCDIVTAEDAQTVLDEPAVEPADDDSVVEGLEVASCLWEVEDDTSFKLLQFRLYDGAQFYGEDLFAQDEGFQDVPDLGDDAFIVGTLGQSLYILDGDQVVNLDVSAFNIDDPAFTEEAIRERLIELGQTVLDRT